jgi:hypothetical protein
LVVAVVVLGGILELVVMEVVRYPLRELILLPQRELAVVVVAVMVMQTLVLGILVVVVG